MTQIRIDDQVYELILGRVLDLEMVKGKRVSMNDGLRSLLNMKEDKRVGRDVQRTN